MLTAPAIASLRLRLAQSTQSIEFGDGPFGRPEFVAVAAHAAEKLFQGYAKARPSAEDAYAAVLAFARHQEVSDLQRHLIASALSVPIREIGGHRALGLPRLARLLDDYCKQAEQGQLWQLTWYGLLGSYFAFDPVNAQAEELAGWERLRALLAQTWPLIDKQAGNGLCPDWLSLLRIESQLLGTRPADKYGRDWLEGRTEATEKLRSDLDIPPSSWFWHELVAGAVRAATGAPDREFIASIPQLLDLVAGRPVCRDDAIEAILCRYHRCAGAPAHERLRDYVIQKDVWRNPKLRDAGYATAWNRVPDDVWLMVLGWVNERNLRDFFDILASRNKADEGRLEFWSQYMKQITWTRLIFSRDTLELARQKAEVRALIAREDGAYATLTVNKDVDAFMMRIGQHIIVEFSKKPNACYIYDATTMKFDRYQKRYTGGTDDLKYGYYDRNAESIRHIPNWQISGAATLRKLGILPDAETKPSRGRARTATVNATAAPAGTVTKLPDAGAASAVGNSVPSARPFASIDAGIPPAPSPVLVDRAPAPARTLERTESLSRELRGANFRMTGLYYMVDQFPDGHVIDGRKADGVGRVCVSNPRHDRVLERWLKTNGFEWSKRLGMWYFLEK